MHRKILLVGALALLASGCVTVVAPPGGTPPPSTSATGAPNAPAPAPSVPAPPQFSTANKESVTKLLTILRDLVNTAPDLARVRWAAKQPATDPALDKRLMDMATQLAPLHNAPLEGTRALMQAQIGALNYAKRGMFDLWQSTPTTLPARPGAEARAESLIGDLVKQFANVQSALPQPGARGFIEAKSLELLPERSAMSAPIRRMVMTPLLDAAAR